MFAGLATVVVAAPGGLLAVVGGSCGLLLIAAGVFSSRSGPVTAGVLVQVAGLILAGLNGLSPTAVLFGLATALIAWDTGQFAITVGEQVGVENVSMRTELIHAGATALVVGATAVVAHGIFSVVADGQPFAALAALAVAALLLVLAIRNTIETPGR